MNYNSIGDLNFQNMTLDKVNYQFDAIEVAKSQIGSQYIHGLINLSWILVAFNVLMIFLHPKILDKFNNRSLKWIFDIVFAINLSINTILIIYLYILL